MGKKHPTGSVPSPKALAPAAERACGSCKELCYLETGHDMRDGERCPHGVPAPQQERDSVFSEGWDSAQSGATPSWSLKHRDAILAVFKGLPAMQKEDITADMPSQHTRNALRRQILAELEEASK